MMSRPIHRRVSFWLGLFVALFLAWARWDSTIFETGVTCRIGGSVMGGIRHEAATHLFYGIPAPVGYWHVPVYYPGMMDLDQYFAPYQYNGMESGHVKVPDALVLAGYLVLWGWWLARRGRMEREHDEQRLTGR